MQALLRGESEDGCRMATRSELEHGRGLSSLLDRAADLIRGADG